MANKYLDGNSLLAIKDYIDTPLSEIKSLIYDNQVPAVANLPVPYATNYALPSQISGDKIIMSAGMDMAKVKGRSYVVNQWVPDNQKSFTNSTVDTRDLFTCAIQLWNNDVYITDLYMNYEGMTNGFKILLLSPTNSGNRVVFKHSGAAHDLIFADFYCDIVAGQKYLAIFNVISNNPSVISGLQTNNHSFIKLMQWFGSNDTIPDDLLADPSLFTKKYWQGELPYDIGHIEDSKPIKIVSVGFNLCDEIFENKLLISNGTTTDSDEALTTKNYIKVIPNSTYYFKVPSGVSGIIGLYDKNRNFITREFFENTTFTIPQGCEYILFCANNYGTDNPTYNNDICINISDPLLNGKYLPYQKNEYPVIPIQTLTIDLGTKTWTGSNGTFQTLIDNPLGTVQVLDCDNALYVRVESSSDLENEDYAYYFDGDYLYFRNAYISTASGFTQDISGTHITITARNQPYEPLRSAGNVQDDNEKVNVGVVDLGSLDWTLQDYGTGKLFASSNLPIPHKATAWDTVPNLRCSKYLTQAYTILYGGAQGISTYTSTNTTTIIINDTNYNDGASLKTALSGVMLYYELETPTDQSPAITLPENIEIQKGGTIEIEYDDGYSTPCDFDFEVAVSKVLEE